MGSIPASRLTRNLGPERVIESKGNLRQGRRGLADRTSRQDKPTGQADRSRREDERREDDQQPATYPADWALSDSASRMGGRRRDCRARAVPCIVSV